MFHQTHQVVVTLFKNKSSVQFSLSHISNTNPVEGPFPADVVDVCYYRHEHHDHRIYFDRLVHRH